MEIEFGKKIKKTSYYKQRCELAAVLRWTARLNMHESVVNHFSVSVDRNRSKFLINPGGLHFSLIKASDLILIDGHNIKRSLNDLPNEKRPLVTALDLHTSVHKLKKNAACILHVHSKYATVLSTIKNKKGQDPQWSGYLPPVDQNSMRFYERISIDQDYDGMAKGNEAKRIAKQLGDKKILLLGNHGVMVIGLTVAKAFDDLYYFEKACETYVTALSTGKELQMASHKIASNTAKQWENFKPSNIADLHLKSLMAILDKEDPDYKE